MSESDAILAKLKLYLEPLGMEVYMFQVDWYNQHVAELFKLPYKTGTTCAVILTIPSFFDTCFLPYLRNSIETNQTSIKDPIDSCIAYHVSSAVKSLAMKNVHVMYDYELYANRRPKVLVQTAAHVAGAAFYYQRHHVVSDPWEQRKNIFGICIHPQFGGWFAIRSVLVFEDISTCLEYLEPIDSVPETSKRIELLQRLNDNWRDWTYRDIISVKEKYSEKQKLYFSTPPKDRNLTFLQNLL